jgi:hypothetical protein
MKKLLSLFRRLFGTERLNKKIDAAIMALDYEIAHKMFFGAMQLPAPIAGGGNKQFIVTLTSYGNRIFTTAPFAIYSMFQQTMLPDRVVLYLTKEVMTPQLSKLRELGLEIRYCEELRSHTKLVPALRDFPEDVLITIDDDVYYPSNWFFKLKSAYLKDPARIWCHSAHEIVVKRGRIAPYAQWRWCVKSSRHENRLFPRGTGGILYPPHSLHPLVTDASEFLKLAPTADDIWFWAMAVLKGTRYGLVENGYDGEDVIASSETGERPLAQVNCSGANDTQMEAVLKRFPELLEKIR